jgi:Icc-related predicted phosphoesterase
MKILAFSDTHASLSALRKVSDLEKKNNPDVIVCAGDISIFGSELDSSIKEMSKMRKPILLVPGNHETEEELQEAIARYDNFVIIHNGILRIDDVVFLGHGGGGFSDKDKEFEHMSKNLMKQVNKAEKLVLVTHAPPYSTKLDVIMRSHVGNRSYREFIDMYKPLLAISGHLHENFKVTDKRERTLMVNPGPFGMILDV